MVPNSQTHVIVNPAITMRGSGGALRALSWQTGSSMTFQPDAVVSSSTYFFTVTEGLNMNGNFNTFFLRGASTRRLAARFGGVSNITNGNNILIGAGADWGNISGTFNTINVGGSNSSVVVDPGGTMTADLNLTNNSGARISGSLGLRNLNVSSGSRFELLNGGSLNADPFVLTRVRVDGGTMLLRGGSNMNTNGPGYQMNLLNGGVFSSSGNSHVNILTSIGGQIDLLGGTNRFDRLISNSSNFTVSSSATFSSGNVTINGGTFNYSNNASINAAEIRLNGGTINTSQFSTTALGANVFFANGNINANIVGGASDHISLSGTLNLGNQSSANGFNYGGSLDIARHHANLLDQDIAHLGFETNMTNGGQLSSTNGIELLAGRVLNASGMAQVNGFFKNQGAVNASLLEGEVLEFTGDVSGEGLFTGNILLSNTFDPGNSTALVSFENLQFGAEHELNFELGGLIAGDEFDKLTVSGDLDLAGLLNIELIDGFQLGSDDVFEIISVDGLLNGQFAGLEHGDLVGNFGGQDLFISYKFGDGNNVALVSNAAAVPEPGSLFFAGCYARCLCDNHTQTPAQLM